MTQDELEAPLLSVMPTKAIVEMTDEELQQFHSRHRQHRLSMQVLQSHLRGNAAPASKPSPTKEKELALKGKYV
jgi:hypothetical protein